MPALRAYRDASPLATQHFERCVLAKVYFGSRFHSAYYGRRSERALGAQGAAYRALSFRQIQRDIEKRRVGGQGSVWRTYELPAVAFMARTRALLVFDLSNAKAGALKRTTIKSTLIRDIARQFQSYEDISLYDVSNGALSPAILPFRAHTSFQSGRTRLLGWRPNQLEEDFTPLLQSVLQFISRTILWRQEQKPQT